MPISAQWNTPRLILWELTQDPPVTLMLLCVTKQRKERKSTFWWGGALTAAFLPKAKYTFQTLLSHHQERMTAPERGTAGPGPAGWLLSLMILERWQEKVGIELLSSFLAWIHVHVGSACYMLHKCCTALCSRDFLIKASINENNIIADQSSYLSELIFRS